MAAGKRTSGKPSGSAGAVVTPVALARAIEDELASVRVSLPRRLRALEELHELFTEERPRVKRLAYLDVPRLRDAYLRYHLPLNVARVTQALGNLLALHPRVGELLDVVDLGAGPGSASLASLLCLPPRDERRYLLFDRSRTTLQVAIRLLSRVAAEGDEARERFGRERVAVHTGSLPRLPRMPRRSLVWLSMVLNELGLGERRGVHPTEFAAQLARALDPPSVVVILEPALRGPSRKLLELHDDAVESGDWRVLAPCTHQQGCPLLRVRDRSWCHFRFQWRAPRLVQEVANPLGLDWEAPSLSFLVLERIDPGVASPPPISVEAARIIGDRMPLQGGHRGIYACRNGARETLRAAPAGTFRGDIVEGKDGRVVLPWSFRARAKPPSRSGSRKPGQGRPGPPRS